MKVVVIASRKGGTGKTTLTGHLGVTAVLKGDGPVALLDTDEQGSLSRWWNCRESPTPSFVSVGFKDLGTQLEAMREQGFAYALIDTPPGMNEEARRTLEAIIPSADLVLIPTRPSPHDLDSVTATVELAEKAGKRIVFVLNGAAYRARITAQAAVFLSEFGAVCPTIIMQRTDLASSMTDGRTAMEIEPEGRSAQEIASVWKYVRAQVSKKATK